MKTTQLLQAGLLLAAAGLALQPAQAAELITLDGGRFTLQSVVTPGAPDAGSGFLPSAVRASLVWTFEDADGSLHEGAIAASGGVRDELPLLVQNPADGEVHMIFSSVHESTRDLFLRTWLGQSWSDPVWLAGTPSGDDLRPRAVFVGAGEIVLAWTQERLDGNEHVLFQYGLMDASGMLARHAHVDMGRPAIYTSPVAGDVRLGDGVAQLVADGGGEQAVLFLADSEQEDVGVIRLDLRALRQIGGGGSFAPVPVNFLQVAMSNGLGSISDRIAAAGEILATWRVEMLGGEGYYWLDQETMSGIAFRDGIAKGLVTLARPAEEIEAHATMVALLRMRLGRIESELEPILARQEALRSRRVR